MTKDDKGSLEMTRNDEGRLGMSGMTSENYDD